MKKALFAAGVLGLSAFLMNVTGCETDQVQTHDHAAAGSYSALLDGTPDKVTSAAQKACADLKLLDVVGAGTKVDGRVTARDAQGDNIAIDIAQAGDKVSRVTVYVGPTGDPSVSEQLINRIKADMSSWL